MRILTIPALVAFLALQPLKATAQNDVSDVRKTMLYETRKKEPLLAMGMACCATSAGHAYVGNWKRGLVFSAFRIGGSVIAYTIGMDKEPNTESGYFQPVYKYKPNGWYIFGMGISIVAMLWEPFDDYDLAEKHNEQLKKEIFKEEAPGVSFLITPIYGGGKAGLCCRF